MRGIPRVPWNAEGIFDGVSTFRLDRKGMIYEHQASMAFYFLQLVVSFPCSLEPSAPDGLG